ncbi:MAG: glycosyltransferase family 9 protein [Bacteroidota bacterium]|nr:glycosyltransferase family 9 protein [Bacteroidota bacterium]MDP4289056.1 glycosyltransferase family 9 protein [Bacteroidota bacterium]
MSQPSILILRLSSLGDIVLTTPLVRALRERYPDSRIDFVIAKEYESLTPLFSGISQVHVFDKSTGLRGLWKLRQLLKRESFNFVLDIHNVLRTQILRRGIARKTYVVKKRTLKRWLLVRFKHDTLQGEPDIIGRYFEVAKALGVEDDGTGPQLQVSVSRIPTRIAIAPGARHWNKRWPTEYFQAVAASLIEWGYQIVFHGSAAERESIEGIRSGLPEGSLSYAGELSLLEVARSLATCAVAITNDSGLMHLAVAVGTPVVAPFGPTVRQFGFAPRDPKSVVLEIDGLYCRPCTAIGLDHCPEKHFRCMREIEPERVLASVDQITTRVST